MKKVYSLNSRYIDVKTSLNSLDDKEFIIDTDSHYTRVMANEENNSIEAIDFEGGPMLNIGDTLEGIGEITKITATYLIQFK